MSAYKDVRGLTLYPTDRMSLSMLSDSDRGQLLLSLFDCFEGVDTSSHLAPQAQMAYAFISARMAEDIDRYNHRREVNRSNAAKRWSVRESPTPQDKEDA